MENWQITSRWYIHLKQMSIIYIHILVYCFGRSVDWNNWLATKEYIIYQIMKILKDNHLGFAYPTITIRQEKDKI
jgi:MscS family membrane protein